MRIVSGFLVVVCSVLFFGCDDVQSGDAGGQQNAVVITSENFDRIAGMQWILQKMMIDGDEYPLTGEKPFVTFDGRGKVNGFASINRFFGVMQVDGGGAVSWPGAFGATRMAGPDDLMRQENAFLAAMQVTEQASLGKRYLRFQTKDGETKLVFFVSVD